MSNFFHTLENTPFIPNGHETSYISHKFPAHVIYRPRYKDNYVTDLTEYRDNFLIRTGTASKDVKWFQKRLPNFMINKDKGYGIWFAKAPCKCQDCHDKQHETKHYITKNTFPLLLSLLQEKYGDPGNAVLWDGESWTDTSSVKMNSP